MYSDEDDISSIENNEEDQYEIDDIQFVAPQKPGILFKKPEPKPKVIFADQTITTLNTQESKVFKPVYTQSMSQTQQVKKQFNYTQKSFNTLPKKSDPVARYQQMNQQWKKSKFLASTNGLKEGRKLKLDERIETQKQQLREEGVFHRYLQKSQLFL